uniref:Small G protein signaling modulator 1b n=1 Tax=Amphiprion ocellaris TaxID=80972 RepID=A0AAQ5XNE2_AMPOC
FHNNYGICKDMIIMNIKTCVKQIMEEAVTRKFVHADSSHIISFCAVVEACVLHGLKRRIAGLLCSNKVAALFMKVAKSFTPAEELCHKVQELEQLIENSKQNNSSLGNDRSRQSKLANVPPQALKHLWIRTALMEKVLDKIVLYLVENSSFQIIELMSQGFVLIYFCFTVGPCALEYTKVKTADHFWTDPSADELVQRHRIHSGHCRQDSPSRRPALIQKRQSSGSMDDRPLMWVREYVESLHQNSRATLLFGKNNVLVQPRDDMEAIPGYLSLHQTADLMTLKWTPNQLMNGNVGELDSEKSVYWDYAMTIRLEEIVYLHCHQQVNSGGTVVLVSQDGIQRPPLHFPKGGHLLQFLTCLETGLLPHGQLDPPLWNQRGKGKVFPKLRKRSPHGSCDSVSDKEDDEATDYVFRILFPGNQMEFSDLTFSDFTRAPLKLLCDTMKYQIISRAFYGWLAYCRHLSTVRTHLSALVNTTIVDPDAPGDARGGLSVEVWGSFLKDSSAYEEKEIHRLVYFGGVAPSLRKEVWPFLLGHYQFTMTEKWFLFQIDEHMRLVYEQTMKEWQGCEAIVQQRERQKHAEALARCSSGASVERGPVQRDSTISTDTVSESEVTEEPGISKSNEKSEAEVEEKDTLTPDVLKEVDTNMNLKSAPENTNVLKLETEIHNEYFQAPPLGQTLQAHKSKDQEEEPSCPPAAEKDSNSPSELSEPPETIVEKISPQTMKICSTEPEAKDVEATVCDFAETRKIQETLDMYLINLHRIDKDVRRCDRTYWYFTPENLEKLRNIMCSYVWQHLDTGYVQGMCDLLAPLLVILDDEVMAFSCFTELMKRMNQNFPHGGAMDSHFANMRSLIQILDSELFELMQQNGDYTHFYFCYRWFLLDFKREMVYDDVFSVWETIWAAKHTSSEHFVLFTALALVEMYRDIILENNMDFTDIIKFFNEMAERHNVPQVLMMARDLVHKVQTLIENK